MPHLNELTREYESRFPPTRRLDLQGEGPETARTRTLRWLQMFAHEQPGADLLLVVQRGRRAGARKNAVWLAVEKLLGELTGGLIESWHPFGEGTLALRIAREPRMVVPTRKPDVVVGEGRSAETAGAAYLHPEDDIPEELLPIARRAAELRRDREGLPVGVLDVVLRKLWIEAQAQAMSERIRWEDALRIILKAEELRLLEEE